MNELSLSRARDRLADGVVADAVDLAPLLGSWRVFSEQTTGISRARVSESGGRVTLGVTGSADGGDPDWGEVEARVYAESVAGGPAWGLRADYEHEDSLVRLYGYLNRGLLALEAGTSFTDASGRADYFTRTFLFRP